MGTFTIGKEKCSVGKKNPTCQKWQVGINKKIVQSTSGYGIIRARTYTARTLLQKEG